MNLLAGALVGLTLLAAWYLVCYAIEWGYERGAEDAAENAVKAGKAEYYLDEENKRQWRWK